MSQSFTKQQLISSVAREVGESQERVRDVLEAAISRMTSELAAGRRVEVRGFGIFTVRMRSARRGMNPATGEMMRLAARPAVNFRVGCTLRRALDASSRLRELKPASREGRTAKTAVNGRAKG